MSGQDNAKTKAEQPELNLKMPDPVESGRKMAELSERFNRVAQDFMARQSGKQQDPDPLNLSNAFMEMANYWWQNPFTDI